MKTIAICSNISEFDQGAKAWTDKDVCDKYPGSHWMIYFDKWAREAGFDVVSGLDALERNIENAILVQEELNPIGDMLVDTMRAKRSTVICLESPLFTPLFYDQIGEVKKLFPHQILFGKLGNHTAYFPSFDETEEIPEPNWIDRKKKLCMVASNKHYNYLLLSEHSKNSPSFHMALENQLHDRRYEAIFKMRPDIYGRGWDNEIPAGHKIRVMRDYQYAVCFENISMPGYITEKIIDCFMAGTVPLFQGAPDIDAYIPFSCYIEAGSKNGCAQTDLSKFTEHQKWFDKNNDLFLYNAKRFLESDHGKKFSYQSFAHQVLDCVLMTH